MEQWSYHYQVKMTREAIRGRFAAFQGPVEFVFEGYQFRTWWENHSDLRLTVSGECPDDQEPQPGLALPGITAAMSLFLEADLGLDYRNHTIDGRGRVSSSRCAYTRIGDPLPTFDFRALPPRYEEAVHGILYDRDLRASYEYFRLGIRLHQLDRPGGDALSIPPALMQFGIAIEAVGYRLRQSEGLDDALNAIGTYFRQRLPGLSNDKKAMIRSARNQGAHYHLPAGRSRNTPQDLEDIRLFVRDLLIEAGLDAHAGNLPPPPPPRR